MKFDKQSSNFSYGGNLTDRHSQKSVLIFFILHHKFHFKQICMKMKKNNLMGLGNFIVCMILQDLGHLVYSSVTQSVANLKVSVKSRIGNGHVK